MAFISFTDNYYVILALFFLTCAGSGAFHPAAAGLVGSMSKDRKGLIITIFATGGTVGMAVSQLAYYETYHAFGGNTLILLIMPLLLAILIFFQKFREGVKGTDENHLAIRETLKLFKNREMTHLYISQICNQTLLWGTLFLLPDILVIRGYEDWVAYGGASLCFLLSGGFMMIPAGYLADHFSAKNVVIIVSVLSLIFFTIFLSFTTLPPLILLPLLVMLGACLGVVNPVSISLGHHMMPSKPGVVSSFLMGMVWCVAEILGPGGGGLMSKLFTEDAPAKALALLGLLFFVGIYSSFRLPYIIPEKAKQIPIESV